MGKRSQNTTYNDKLRKFFETSKEISTSTTHLNLLYFPPSRINATIRMIWGMCFQKEGNIALFIIGIGTGLLLSSVVNVILSENLADKYAYL